MATPEALGRWPVAVRVPVAWGEMDSLGHVNNAVYLRWCETARIAYLERCGLLERLRTEKVGPILARASLDFRRPVTFPDTVTVKATVQKLGNTSLTIAYRIESEAQAALVAEGDSVVVVLDFATGAKVPLSDELRTRIAALEAGGPG